jgi:hypothetical protein
VPQQKIYLDDNGEPIQQSAQSGAVYLDDSGNPKQAESEPGMIDRMLADNANVPPSIRAGLYMLRTIKKNPIESLAAGGALAGAAATAPVSVPAAMLAAGAGAAGGAGLGIAGRQLVTGKPESGMDTAATMAKQGAMNAAGEGAGRAVVGGANIVVPKLLKGILRPKPTILDEFPDVVKTMREQRIPVGQSAEAKARMSASSAKADDMVQQAQNAGATPVSPREIVKEFRPLRDEVTRRAGNAAPGAPSQMGEIVERAKGLKDAGDVDIVTNRKLQQQAQRDANDAFRKQSRGAEVKDTTAKLEKAVAVGRQKAGEARVTGLGAQNANTQELMGLTKALRAAEGRSGAAMGWNPVHLLGDLFPSLASRATFAGDAAAQGMQSPPAQLLRQALLSLLVGDSPERPE